MADTKRLAVDLDKVTFKRLKLVAAVEEVTVASIVRKVIAAHLGVLMDDLDDHGIVRGLPRDPLDPVPSPEIRSWEQLLDGLGSPAEGGE